jgi:hypothetical protein
MDAVARLFNKLAARLIEQQQQQLQQLKPQLRHELPLHMHLLRQQHHDCNQQQQQGQLPPDQQIELDNSLNSLTLSALHMWLLLFHALAAAAGPSGGGSSSNSSCAVTTSAAGASATPAAVYAKVGAGLAPLAGCVTAALRAWPVQQAELAADSSRSSAGSNSLNSGSSSNRQVVRYGNVVLPQLPVVDVTHALEAAFELMQTVSLAMDAVQHCNGVTMQQLVQQQGQKEALACAEQLHKTAAALADPSVLELQLLLLACQAKLRHQQLAVTQQGRALVHEMTQNSWRQQQQVGLPAAHQLLLANYDVQEVDLAQLAQQQQQQQPEQQRTATAQYIRCVITCSLSDSNKLVYV